LNQFIEQLDCILLYQEITKLESIICSDININYLIESYEKEQLQLLLDMSNLVQIIDFPTITSLTSISLIDNFFLDRSIHKNFQVYLAINGHSDCDSQILILENLQIMMQNKCNMHLDRLMGEKNYKFLISTIKLKLGRSL
jgi:hypothetical protein